MTGGRVCIHGHFYQPWRGDPWTGVVPRETSAAPWHDWNERIHDECYLPNTAARILDGQGQIDTALSTYSRISFDAAPTLLSWLEHQHPGTYEALLRADRDARGRFSGHGSAIAHPCHHLILPLLPRRDKVTEVRWGIADFEERFSRYPEGMWLPEMAVDNETLEVLADHDIRFTVLSPHQVWRFRSSQEEDWMAGGGQERLRHPLVCRLPSGREMALFFHDAAIGHEVAFGTLLEDGDRFAGRLLSAASSGGLVSVATDGETFGHHRKFGEMALAWCLRTLGAGPSPLTVFGEYLEKNPPSGEVELAERTSWSCPHGLSRWDQGCECPSGRHEGWSHDWRGPFRAALSGLASVLSDLYAREAEAVFTDPWAARDDAIRLMRDPSPGRTGEFMTRHGAGTLSGEPLSRGPALLEMSVQCLAMQTSCALFFDDIADREAVQALRHAARALQVAKELTGADLGPWFRDLLGAIPGNRPHLPDGGAVYRDCVLPLVLSAREQAACLALAAIGEGRASLSSSRPASGDFIAIGEIVPVHDLSFAGRPIRYCLLGTDRDETLLGVTTEPGVLAPEIGAGIYRVFRKEGYAAARDALRAACSPPPLELAEIRPAGRRIVIRDQLHRMQEVIDEAAGIIFDRYACLVEEGEAPGGFDPGVFRLAAYVLTWRLRSMLEEGAAVPGALAGLASGFDRWGVRPDARELGPAAEAFLGKLAQDWAGCPEDQERLARLVRALAALADLGIPVRTWSLQNIFLDIRDGAAVTLLSASGDPGAAAWTELFVSLGKALGVRTG